NGDRLDGFPSLVEYHITVRRKVREISEDDRADQHGLASQDLHDLGLAWLIPPQRHMRRHDRKPTQLRDQKSARMKLVSRAESNVKRIRRTPLFSGLFPLIECRLNLFRGGTHVDGMGRYSKKATPRNHTCIHQHGLQSMNLRSPHGHASTRSLLSCQ